MKKALSLIAFAALAVGAFGATVNLNTGAGQAAWTCLSAPVGQACTVNSLGTAPNSVWASSAPYSNTFGVSSWVGPTATSGALAGPSPAGGNYVYTLTLTPGITNGFFSLVFAADNGGIVEFLNGGVVVQTPVPFTTPGGNGFGSPVQVSGNLVGTATTLRVTVFNDTLPPGGGANTNPSPSGFFINGALTDIPEPSTWAMLSLGGAAILLARLRRKA